MQEEEFSEIDEFCLSVFDYVRELTNFKAYVDMTEESQRRWREKLTITICKEFSPRKNYDISKDEVRALVNDAIEILMEPANE